LVEQLIRNQQVTRSSRVAGSRFPQQSHVSARCRDDESGIDSQSDSHCFQLPDLKHAILVELAIHGEDKRTILRKLDEIEVFQRQQAGRR
jgi:hypothetical protein